MSFLHKCGKIELVARGHEWFHVKMVPVSISTVWKFLHCYLQPWRTAHHPSSGRAQPTRRRPWEAWPCSGARRLGTQNLLSPGGRTGSVCLERTRGSPCWSMEVFRFKTPGWVTSTRSSTTPPWLSGLMVLHGSNTAFNLLTSAVRRKWFISFKDIGPLRNQTTP